MLGPVPGAVHQVFQALQRIGTVAMLRPEALGDDDDFVVRRGAFTGETHQALPYRLRQIALCQIENTLRNELESHGFIVMEPGVLPGTDPRTRTASELARAVGADVAVDVGVRLRRTSIRRNVVGIVAEVSAYAVRVRDGFELAEIRLDTPAYHLNPDEATMR